MRRAAGRRCGELPYSSLVRRPACSRAGIRCIFRAQFSYSQMLIASCDSYGRGCAHHKLQALPRCLRNPPLQTLRTVSLRPARLPGPTSPRPHDMWGCRPGVTGSHAPSAMISDQCEYRIRRTADYHGLHEPIRRPNEICAALGRLGELRPPTCVLSDSSDLLLHAAGSRRISRRKSRSG